MERKKKKSILVTLEIFFPSIIPSLKSISRDILGLRAVDDSVSSNMNKSVNLL